MINDKHTNIVVKKTRDTIILMTERILAKERDKNINIVIDSGVTNYCVANVNAFTEYKKFETLLVGRIVKKRINFSIAG